MTYRIVHTNLYTYSRNVSLCHNLAHLTARSGPGQTAIRSDLVFSTTPSVLSTRTDSFGNLVTFFTVQEPHKRLEVTATNLVRVHPRAVPEPSETPNWESARDALRSRRDPETLDAYQFAFDSRYIKHDPRLVEYASPSFPPGRPLLEAALDLTRRIYREFRFDAEATSIDTPLHELLEKRRGVCQDFANLGIGCLRSLGLAARYVSGYLLTNPPPGQERLIGGDVSHAWLSTFVPGSGWIDFDPTNDVIPREKHIILAWGRDYDDVSPLKGVMLGGGQHSLSVGVDVRPVDGD